MRPADHPPGRASCAKAGSRAAWIRAAHPRVPGPGPVCRRPARNCDFEHNTPYEAGGRTCLCNGARSAVTITGLSSSPGGRSISCPTGRSGGPPRPGAATTPNPPATRSSRQRDGQQRLAGLRFRASRWWGGAVVAGPGDEIAAAEGQPRSEFRASHADRERLIEVLKAAFVQGRLAKDEFDLRVGHAFAARTYAELAAVTAGLHAEPATARPTTPARAQIEPPVVRPGRLITGGDRGLRGRVDVRLSRAMAQGCRGRSPARSRVAGLRNHPHLPVRSGDDPVAWRGGDG